MLCNPRFMFLQPERVWREARVAPGYMGPQPQALRTDSAFPAARAAVAGEWIEGEALPQTPDESRTALLPKVRVIYPLSLSAGHAWEGLSPNLAHRFCRLGTFAALTAHIQIFFFLHVLSLSRNHFECTASWMDIFKRREHKASSQCPC